MRLRPLSRLLQRQDVCFFCAFRQDVEAQTSRRLFLRQSRPYKSTAASLKPATGVATAQKEEEEDEESFPMLRDNAAENAPNVFAKRDAAFQPPQGQQSPYETMPDWHCRCGHINSAKHTTSCIVCGTRKPTNPKLYYHRRVASQYLPEQSPYIPPSLPEFTARRQQPWTPQRNGEPRILGEGSPTSRSLFQRRAPEESGYETRMRRFGQYLPTGQKLEPSNTPPTYQNWSGTSPPDDKSSVQSPASTPRSPMRNRFGPFSDDRTAAIPSLSRLPSNTPAAGSGSRPPMRGAVESSSLHNVQRKGIGVFGLDELERTSNPRSVPARTSNSRGTGVFGLDELEQASAPKRPPTRANSARGVGVFGLDQLENTAPSTKSFKRGRHVSDEQSPKLPSTQPLVQPARSIIPPVSSSEYSPFGGVRRDRGREERFERRNKRFDIDDKTEATGSEQHQNKTQTAQQRSVMQNVDFDPVDEDEFLSGRSRRKKNKKPAQSRNPATKPQLQLPEFISVEKLAQSLKVKLDDFLLRLEEEGFEGARYDHVLDAENSAMLADLYGFEPIFGGASEVADLVARPQAEDRSLLPPRPPIVTIMGHVDHGKTTILDWLRKSSVVETEHGGITQHIGAFQFTMPGSARQITFLDTPGHAAFLDMRRRGATVTDIVVLVVAADDSVKPQTLEAIKHSLDAKVQIIVAINKIDKQDADPERVKRDLSQHDIIVEDLGGEYQAIPLSGKTGQGMDNLEEAILTLADVSDFRAEVDIPAEGWVIESQVTMAGRVATILVRRGTLRPGDIIVAGTTWSRVRTLRNDAGALVNEALPGTPVQVDGWRGDPIAGLEMLGATDEEHAKKVVEMRLEQEESLRRSMDLATINATRTEEAEARTKVLEYEAEQKRNFIATSHGRRRFRLGIDNEGWVEGDESAGPQKIHFVVKADVTGSVEALVAAVSAVGNHEISANVVHSGAGLLTESDIRLLAATGETSYAISFNQPIENSVARLAEVAGVQILDHNIIYKATDDVKAKLSDALPPIVTQKVSGEAEIGQIFEISTKKGKVKIAGCRVSNGTISRSHPIRVLRKGDTVYTGTLESLKNVKKDVTEMRKGSECGVGFDNWSDFEVGDQVQSFEEKKEKRTLY